MTPVVRRVALSLGVYVGVVLLPLAVAALGAPPARGFWIEFGVGLGFVALAMFALQFALTARFRQFAGFLGQDTMLQFHREAALVAFALVLAHPLVLLIAHPPFVQFFDPRANLPRAGALIAVLILLVAIIATTIWRTALRIPYERWRLAHGIMGTFILVIGIVHVMRVNHYISAWWKQAFWAAMIGGAILLLLHLRIVKPLRMLRRPYVVTDVRPEAGGAAATWTISLQPVNHDGMRFKAGQFAWLTLGTSPFSLQQHPFSFASSANDRGSIQFTIKALGDFTARIGEVPPGTRAYLEGPYGAFTLDEGAAGGVFIAGGIGITPVVSILRTLRDRGDRRPHILFVANVGYERIVFREELEHLQRVLKLHIIHILEQPPSDWSGSVGRITPELLDRHLPGADESYQYLVCGPDPMMDAVEMHLLKRGVPLGSIRSERFNIA